MDMLKGQTEPLKMNNIFLQRDDIDTFNRKLMDYPYVTILKGLIRV